VLPKEEIGEVLVLDSDFGLWGLADAKRDGCGKFLLSMAGL
jgi:hypothetical protein